MKCSSCGTESSGNFCPACGASLRSGNCADCGATLVPGARFCTRCGASVAGAPVAKSAAGNPNLPWYAAGAVLLLLIIILVVPMITNGNTTTPGPFVPPAGGTSSGTPPPLTGTPREQADRLFDRIMRARAAGDAAEALRFTPMAIQAYAMAAPLDEDGLYHLATVHIVAGDPASARSTADEILAGNADHLLGLAIAGEAAAAAGDSAAARTFYTRFLDAYDSELASGRQEYQDHSQVMPEYRATAQRVTGG
jgi:hypothetical protein